MFSVSSRALAFYRPPYRPPDAETPTGRPFRDGPFRYPQNTAAPQTQKAPDALASGAYMQWWSCVNKNHTFYTINSNGYIFCKNWDTNKNTNTLFSCHGADAPCPPFILASRSCVGVPVFRIAATRKVFIPGRCWFTRAAACLAWEKRNSVVRIPFGPGAPCGAAPPGKGIPAHDRGRPTPARHASSRS